MDFIEQAVCNITRERRSFSPFEVVAEARRLGKIGTYSQIKASLMELYETGGIPGYRLSKDADGIQRFEPTDGQKSLPEHVKGLIDGFLDILK